MSEASKFLLPSNNETIVSVCVCENYCDETMEINLTILHTDQIENHSWLSSFMGITALTVL